MPLFDREFDCVCCHGLDAHAVDAVRMVRGECLIKDCVHECKQYVQQKKSAFWEMLDTIHGLLNREEKIKALLAENWSLEEWLERFRNTPWPQKAKQDASVPAH